MQKRHAPRPQPPTPENLRLVSCATCEKDLLGESSARWLKGLSFCRRKKFPPMCKRYRDRPYCVDCLYTITQPERIESTSTSRGNPGERRGRMVRDEDPSLQNAIRNMEDNPEGIA